MTLREEEVLYHKTVSSTLSLSADKGLQKGCAYNFKTTLTLDVVQNGLASFEIEHLRDWDDVNKKYVNGEDQWNTFDDLSKIWFASKFGGSVTLQDSYETSNYTSIVDDITIDLNGKSLTFDDSALTNSLKSEYFFNVYNEGRATNNEASNISTLTIEGIEIGSSIISNTKACLATVGVGGEVRINGGTHQTKGQTLYDASNGGKIAVFDGEFKSTSGVEPYTLLKGEKENVIVSGGSFYKWHPGVYLNPQTNFNGITGSFIVHQKDDWYNVGKKVDIPNYDILDNYKDEEDVLEYDITQNITNPTLEYIPFGGKEEVTINNQGSYTISTGTGDNSGGWYGLSFNTCNSVTLNNLYLDKAGIYFVYGETLELNNCKVCLDLVSSAGGRHCLYIATNNPPGPSQSQVTINGGEFWIEEDEQECFIAADLNARVTINDGEFYIYKSNDTETRIKDITTFPNVDKKPFSVRRTSLITLKGGTYGFNIGNFIWKEGEQINCTVLHENYKIIEDKHADGGTIWRVVPK